MNFERVLDYVKDRVLSLGLASISLENIALPNAVFSPIGKALWLELSIAQGSQLPSVETKDSHTLTLNQVVCVPVNSETARANNIAAQLASLYSVRDYDKCCHTLETGEELMVDSVAQMPGIVVNDVYKTNVRVVFITKE